MNTSPPLDIHASPVSSQTSTALAFVHDGDSAEVMRRCFALNGMADAEVVSGDVGTAIAQLPKRGSPRLLVVDISGVEDPLHQLGRLAEVSDPSTEVVVVGDRNDIVLYRSLKAAGVAEYFFKPLVVNVVARELQAVSKGEAAHAPLTSGRLVIVLGVRGGVGATTVAANTAWHLSVEQQRKVILVDLDLHGGDAALQVDTVPSNALVEALEHPDRVDDLFLERGIVNIEKRFDLLSAQEPVSGSVPITEAAVMQLLSKLLPRYRYVFLDMPVDIALQLPAVLRSPGTLLLVSDGSLVSARELARWHGQLGAESPDRFILHVLNKKGGDTSLPDEALAKVLPKPPDIVIPYDRHVASEAQLGTHAVQRCATMRHAMAALSRQLTGEPSGKRPHFWQRMFG